MDKPAIDYYFAPNRPYAYLGHEPLRRARHEHGASVNVIRRWTSEKYSRARAACRSRSARRSGRRTGSSSSKRWSELPGMPINIQPKFGARIARPGSSWMLAAPSKAPTGARARRRVMRGRWAEERDIADPATLRYSRITSGLDADSARCPGGQPRVPRAIGRRRRRRSMRRCSARPGTSTTANRSGDRTGSTFWTGHWQNSVF